MGYIPSRIYDDALTPLVTRKPTKVLKSILKPSKKYCAAKNNTLLYILLLLLLATYFYN